MTAPAGTLVSLYVDLVARVEVGDVIETQTGRRYGVVSVRVQQRGKHAGRQHLRVVVLGEQLGDVLVPHTSRVHRIRWYRRESRGRR